MNKKEKRFFYIKEIYLAARKSGQPDTFIVRHVFPRHGIFIGYSEWMKIKKTIFKTV